MKALLVQFAVNRLLLPMDIHYALQSMLFNLIRSVDSSLAHELHSDKQMYHGRRYAPFCFGDIEGSVRFVNGKRVYEGSIILEIRAFDDRIIDALELAMVKSEPELLHQSLRPIFLRESIFQPLTSAATLTLLTPIAMHTTSEDGKVCYLTPEDSLFVPNLIANCQRKYVALTGKTVEGIPIQLEPIAPDSWLRHDATFKDSNIIGWSGSISIYTSPEMLSFLYHTGIGERNGQGFGMIEVGG